MESELHKLRIDKQHKARRDERVIWPWLLMVAVVCAGGAGVWQWHNASAATTLVQTMRVTVPEPSAANADTDLVVLNATGYVVAAHEIQLATKVVGRVAWVGVDMGDKVKKGQVLVRLEDDEYKAIVEQQQGLLDNAKAKLAELEAGSRPQEIAQAKAMLDQAQAERINADIDYKRMAELKGTASVSQQQIDDAQATMYSKRAMLDAQQQAYQLVKIGPRKEEIDAQRATVHQLEGSLALAMVDLDNTVVRSPIDATVLERNVEVGEFVTTGFVGDKGAKGYVVSIADLDDLRVELDISQNDIAKVVNNQRCWITTDAYPNRKYAGIVSLISPEANRQKATVLVRVKVLKPDGLMKPEMNASVAFLSPKKSGSAMAEHPLIRVPASAVRDGSVLVVEDGKALKRTIAPGLTTANGEMEIRKGLIGGEDLILNPPATLHDGDRVTMLASGK